MWTICALPKAEAMPSGHLSGICTPIPYQTVPCVVADDQDATLDHLFLSHLWTLSNVTLGTPAMHHPPLQLLLDLSLQ